LNIPHAYNLDEPVALSKIHLPDALVCSWHFSDVMAWPRNEVIASARLQLQNKAQAEIESAPYVSDMARFGFSTIRQTESAFPSQAELENRGFKRGSWHCDDPRPQSSSVIVECPSVKKNSTTKYLS